MKHSYSWLWLLIGLLWLTRCSQKEIFYFSKGTGRLGTDQRTRIVYAPEKNDASSPSSHLAPAVVVDSIRFVASMELLAGTSINKQRNSSSSLSMEPARQPARSLANRAVEIVQGLETVKGKTKASPEETKPLNHTAAFGFAFSMVALLAGVIGVPEILVVAGVLGLILSIVGLSKVRKHPKKYGGKTLATIGIVVSSLLILASPILIILDAVDKLQ